MAIKHLAGERMIGTAAERAAISTLASTGWTTPTGFTLTSGTGIVVSLSNEDSAVYDLGTSGQLTPNDNWVCDYTITRNSSDIFDHPMLMFKSHNAGYGSAAPNNGDNQILLQYWANGATSDQSGSNNMNTSFKVGGTVYETGAADGVGSGNANIPATGTTLYYRVSMTARVHTMSAWTSAANRTSGGSTGRVAHDANSAVLDNRWDQSDPLRYVMVINRNGNAARWTISDFKFWNGTNDVTTTPAINLTFIDISPNLPNGTIFEQSDDGKHYMFDGTSTWNEMPTTA